MTSIETALLVGLGNIGSHLAQLLVRIPAVRRLIVVDWDVVEAGNLLHQDYGQNDVGKSKVRALCARFAGLRPELKIDAVRSRVEDLPVGAFGGVTLLALDSNNPRSVAAERVFRMGGNLIDCGVNGPAGLARVTRIDHGPVCLECSWTSQTYENNGVHACSKVPPTLALAALGAAAASLAAMQLQSLADGEVVGAREYVFAPGSGQLHTTQLVRNPACRFDHHRYREPEQLGFHADLTLGEVFERADVESLSVSGFSFVSQWLCACGYEDSCLRLSRGWPCPACRQALVPGLGGERSVLNRGDLGDEMCARLVEEEIGFLPGEVVTAPGGRVFQLGRFSGLERESLSGVATNNPVQIS